MLPPPPLKSDSASQANFQALSTQLSDSCSAPILEPERSALLQEALADSHLQAVKAQLEGRGFGMNTDEAQAVQLVGGVQLLIPFGQDAHLVWTRVNGQTAAIGLVRQGNKTLNVSATGEERVVRFLPQQKVEKLLRKLRERSKFQEFEGKLAQRGKRVGRVRVLLDETNKIAILGIASEGNEEKIAHQVRIKVKASREDEPEDDAEPVIQATACGQASGEAVALGARMQPLMLDPGEGGDITGGYNFLEGRDYDTNICISQWGYIYDCRRIAPILRVTTGSVLLPLAIIPDPVQASFVVWNYGGGTLRGTVSVSAPFSIVSGGSFSLAPGQPQEVVVRFTPPASGLFSQSATISSNGGNAAVSLTARALTLEEYLDIIVASYNAALQQDIGERGIYLQDRSRGLALYGFPQISRSQLQGLWENFDELATGTSLSLPPHVAQGLELLQSISDEQWRQWIWSLVVAERAGRFEEEYNRLLPVGLSTYIQGYQLLTNSNADHAKAQLRVFVQRLVATGANDMASALTTLCQAQGTCDIRQELKTLGVREALIERIMGLYERARDQFYAPEERQQLHSDVCTILQHIQGTNNLMIRAFVVGGLELLFQYMPSETATNKAAIRVAAQGITNGWQLIALYFRPSPTFHIMFYDPNYPTNQGSRQTLFLVGLFNVSNPNNVINWINNTVSQWNDQIRRLAELFGVRFNFGLIGAVLVGATSTGQIGGMIDALRNAYRNWDGAIFVVWVDGAGRVWFVCIGRGCDLLSPTQQQQNACMLAGRSPDCGAERWTGGTTSGSSSSSVAQLTP